MKKLIALLLVIANLGVLAACDKKDAGDSKSDNKATETSKKKSNSEVEDTGVKISSDLSAGSVFSDGLALVEVDGEKDKTYCINKKGNIVFEVDEDISVDGMLDPFENGYLVIGYGDKNCLYNEKGEITYPEDVGVTGFSSIAIEDGYIIVEKVTADYSSTKKELGVMDLDFNWIVKPSEELYKSFENCMLRHGVTYMYEGSGIAYCHGGYLCCFDDGCYLNLKTGEVTKEPPFDTPSKAWHGGYDANYYYDDYGNHMLDLSHLDNLYYLGDFKNGKALIIFHNREASKYYFTLIDEKGNFQFEPVEWDEEIISTGYQGTQYDGKNNILIVKDGGIQSSTVAKCYDASGNLVGKFETDDKSKWFQIYDGVIVHHTYAGAYGKERIEYYNTDFTPLF